MEIEVGNNFKDFKLSLKIKNEVNIKDVNVQK